MKKLLRLWMDAYNRNVDKFFIFLFTPRMREEDKEKFTSERDRRKNDK